MSGQLVGEVLTAQGRLKEQGLSERAFHALVAIAEKCHAETRQGSVRWDHIRAGLFGASLSTAKRAVKDLKTARLILVVKRGFDNQHGRSCAPIYQIEPLGEWVIQVNQSTQDERVIQVSQSVSGRTDQIRERTGQIQSRTAHPGDPLDGSINGSTGGDVANVPDESEPAPHCARHMPDGTDRNCGPCGDARIKCANFQTVIRNRQKQVRLDAIAACAHCDVNGLREASDDSMIRCNHNSELATSDVRIA